MLTFLSPLLSECGQEQRELAAVLILSALLFPRKFVAFLIMTYVNVEFSLLR